jgi:outer membrane protein insertion porin family
VLYLNKGYINFNINHSSLNLSEDKKNILLKFQWMKANSLNLAKPNFWAMLYTPAELKALQIYKDGDIYSQEKVNAVKQLLLRKYGNAVYYYAEVNVVPQIDKKLIWWI